MQDSCSFIHFTISCFCDFSGGEIVVYFIQVAIGGPVVGFVFAKITLFCLSRIFNDSLAEITITLASTYITYYVGLYLFFFTYVYMIILKVKDKQCSGSGQIRTKSRPRNQNYK